MNSATEREKGPERGRTIERGGDRCRSRRELRDQRSFRAGSPTSTERERSRRGRRRRMLRRRRQPAREEN
ncbi:hypothetical protein EUGRSUZ_A00851 [Eucalyptus grandis]|uniref:Uncharacterized protein n=2 Tax=Eucalyptus grandis TaxID=71139 RepID=A0ACC3M139_EUCGR|nr:hypothetical protein EUGRSUZ_A00851 [Eucalyptus grandis]